MTIDSSKICMKVHTVHEEFELDTKIMAKWERNKQNKTPKMAISKGMWQLINIKQAMKFIIWLVT